MTGVRLALETATDRLCVAAAAPGAEPVERTLEGARRHASGLSPLVERVLAEAGASLRGVEVVVVADGPGSFTGLRVGAAVAKALARGGVRLMAAPSLLARAAAVARPGERILAVSDALRGEVYAGAWTFADAGVHLLASPAARLPEDLATLGSLDRVVGAVPEAVARAITEVLGRPVEPAGPSAASLLALLDRDGGTVAVSDPAAWEPDYGRPAEAQARWEARHGRRLPDPGGRGG